MSFTTPVSLRSLFATDPSSTYRRSPSLPRGWTTNRQQRLDTLTAECTTMRDDLQTQRDACMQVDGRTEDSSSERHCSSESLPPRLRPNTEEEQQRSHLDQGKHLTRQVSLAKQQFHSVITTSAIILHHQAMDGHCLLHLASAQLPPLCIQSKNNIPPRRTMNNGTTHLNNCGHCELMSQEQETGHRYRRWCRRYSTV